MIHISKTQIPVIIGDDYQHVMCEATIIQQNDVVTITMTANGQSANDLMAVLTATEPMGLSFIAIPVTPHKLRIKEND
jgi:hypothetical protein